MANKEKMAVWLYPETKELIQKHLESANAKSMSEFIEKAIKFLYRASRLQHSLCDGISLHGAASYA